MSGQPEVTVRPMTTAEFDSWCERSIETYAADHVKAGGGSLSAARERAYAEFEQLLPQRENTEGVWLLTVLDEGQEPVGILWLGAHPDRPEVAYVWEIEIAQTARGRGYGRAAMVAAEQVVRAAGYAEIGLNVFGFNEPARRLYNSLGYRVVSTRMTKFLG